MLFKVNRLILEHINTQRERTCWFWFFVNGSKKNLCLNIFRHIHNCLDEVIWWRDIKVMPPPKQMIHVGWKKSQANIRHPYENTLLPFNENLISNKWRRFNLQKIWVKLKNIHFPNVKIFFFHWFGEDHYHKKGKIYIVMDKPCFSNLEFQRVPHFKGPRFGAFAFHINGNLFPSL